MSKPKQDKIVLIGNNARKAIDIIPKQYAVVDFSKYFDRIPRLSNVVKTILDECLDAVLFVLDIDYKCLMSDHEVNPNPGILLLKYLRLYNCNTHVCLIGNSIGDILKERPGDFIVTSKGVSVIEPKNINSLSKARFIESLIREKADRLYTKTYFKHEDDFVCNRHYYSNIWGVLQLYKIYRIIEKYDSQTENTGSLSHPFDDIRGIPELSQPLAFLNSYRGLVMQLLYSINDYSILQELKKLNIVVKNSEIANKTLAEIEELVSRKELELEHLKSSQQRLNDFYQLTKRDDLIAKIRSLFGSTDDRADSFIQKENLNIQHQQDSIKQYKEVIDKFKFLKSSEDEILGTIDHQNSNEISTGFQKTIKALHESAPRVLLIDDKAIDGGWGYIFQLMIYGERSDRFHIYQPKKNESVEEITNAITDIIAHNSIDVILMDIRLKDERGNLKDENSVSGIALLEKLKKKWLSIPIIVTTASKQSRYHTLCMANRAIYFWTKPGIEDANKSGSEIVSNYYNLIRTINIITTNPIIDFIYKDFLPLMKEFASYVKNYRFAIAHKENGDFLLGIHQKDFDEEIKQIIYTSFDVMIEKLQICLNTEHEYIDFSRRDMSLVLFLLSFCFEKNINLMYQKSFPEDQNKIGLSQKLLNLLVGRTDVDYKEFFTPDHQPLHEFIKTRNNNTHFFFSSVKTLQYYTVLFFNSLYCLPKDIGKGIEFTLMKGRMSEEDEYYCQIVDIDNTDRKVIVRRNEMPDGITDTKDYLFILERHISLYNYENHDSKYKVRSQGKVGVRSISKDAYIYYIYDLQFHRFLFFNEIDESYSRNHEGVFDYDLYIFYTIKDFKEL